jgi:hypothetical protein
LIGVDTTEDQQHAVRRSRNRALAPRLRLRTFMATAIGLAILLEAACC